MGYSPAATSWMMSSAWEYHQLTSTISYFRKRCLDLQLGKAKPYSFEGEELEQQIWQIQKMRSDNIEFALMKRDFARAQLEEAVEFEWEYAIPYRAAVLLELEWLLPTFDQVVDQCLMNPWEDKNDATLLAYARESADYFYHLIFEHIVEKHLWKQYLCNAVSQEKLVTFIYSQRCRFQQEFESDLRSKASSIYDAAQREWKLDQTSAKILALYISWGMTWNLHNIDDHTLSRHTVSWPNKLSKDQIKKWFPRPERKAA